MEKVLLCSFLLLFFCLRCFSHSFSLTQDILRETITPVAIIMYAAKGNRGLLNYASIPGVYMNTGVMTNLSASDSDWKYVKFNQNLTQPNPAAGRNIIDVKENGRS